MSGPIIIRNACKICDIFSLLYIWKHTKKNASEYDFEMRNVKKNKVAVNVIEEPQSPCWSKKYVTIIKIIFDF